MPGVLDAVENVGENIFIDRYRKDRNGLADSLHRGASSRRVSKDSSTSARTHDRAASDVLVTVRGSVVDRGSPAGPTSVTPVATTPKGSHGARREKRKIKGQKKRNGMKESAEDERSRAKVREGQGRGSVELASFFKMHSDLGRESVSLEDEINTLSYT